MPNWRAAWQVLRGQADVVLPDAVSPGVGRPLPSGHFGLPAVSSTEWPPFPRDSRVLAMPAHKAVAQQILAAYFAASEALGDPDRYFPGSTVKLSQLGELVAVIDGAETLGDLAKVFERFDHPVHAGVDLSHIALPARRDRSQKAHQFAFDPFDVQFERPVQFAVLGLKAHTEVDFVRGAAGTPITVAVDYRGNHDERQGKPRIQDGPELLVDVDYATGAVTLFEQGGTPDFTGWYHDTYVTVSLPPGIPVPGDATNPGYTVVVEDNTGVRFEDGDAPIRLDPSQAWISVSALVRAGQWFRISSAAVDLVAVIEGETKHKGGRLSIDRLTTSLIAEVSGTGELNIYPQKSASVDVVAGEDARVNVYFPRDEIRHFAADVAGDLSVYGGVHASYGLVPPQAEEQYAPAALRSAGTTTPSPFEAVAVGEGQRTTVPGARDSAQSATGSRIN